jgi:hypothetical protein
VIQGHDTWSLENPGVDRLIRLQDLETRARRARGDLERAGNAARDVLTDPLIGERPDLREMIWDAAKVVGDLADEETRA